MVTVSVPGKVHLMGEHAVVYGKPALIAAIDRRLTVSVAPSPDGQTHVSCVEPPEFVLHAAACAAEHYGLPLPPLSVSVRSAIAPGYHLGSSAAVAVGVAGAVSYHLKRLWNPEVINRIAFTAEKRQHGTPSGGDNTAVTMGGFLWFRKELSFLRSFWQVPLNASGALSCFYLADTGRPKETTGEMIARVRARKDAHPAAVERVLAENERATREAAEAMKEGDATRLAAAITAGERSLEAMGVVSGYAKKVIRAVEAGGGVAKILGGGGVSRGVGYVLCFHPDAVRLGASLAPFGIAPEPVKLGEEGIRLEDRG